MTELTKEYFDQNAATKKDLEQLITKDEFRSVMASAEEDIEKINGDVELARMLHVVLRR